MKRKFTFSVLVILLGFSNLLNAQFTSRNSICYEEMGTLTIGDLYDISDYYYPTAAYWFYINAYDSTGSFIGKIDSEYSYGAINSRKLPFPNVFYNKKYGTNMTLLLHLYVSKNSGSGTTDLGTKNYTFSRGYNDKFVLPSEISVIDDSGYPLDSINLFDYITGSGKSGVFASSSATITDSIWNISDLSTSKNLWSSSSTIFYLPTKVNGCGTESVSQTTQLKVDFDFDANIKLCRSGENVDLMEYVNKPLPITYTSIKYTGGFICDVADDAISGTMFDPTKVPSNTSSVTISYRFVQRTVENVEKQFATGSFSISLLDAPATPVINLDKTNYCAGSSASVSLTNTINDYYLYTKEDTFHLTTPVTIDNLSEEYKVIAANKNTDGCYSKTESVIPVDSVNADFTVSNLKPTIGETVVFEAAFTGAESYTWSIDPSKTEQQINYIFNTTGSVNAKLTVESKNGCIVEQTKEIEAIKGSGSASPLYTSKDINIWPLPVENEIHVRIPEITNAVVAITDLSGKIVFSRNTEEETNTFDVSTLKQGMYILTVKMGKSVTVKKFIKE